MPVQPYRPRELQWSVFQGTDAVRRNLLTRHQLRSGAWVRLRNDVYADARLERDHELACRAAALTLPPSVVLAGPSAAYLHGVEHAAGPGDEVHVIASPGRRVSPRRGLRIHESRLAPGELHGAPGLRRTSPVRTAWDVAAWLDLIRAVCVVDGLLALGAVKLDDLHAYVGEHQGSRGWRSAARVASLTDGGAQSRPESQLRVRLVLAGFPTPVTQHPIPVGGGVILHPDLAWPTYRVAVEYDGRWHGDNDRLDLDRDRINQLVRAGWKVVHVTSRGLNRSFPKVVVDVRAALISRGWRP